MLIAKLIIAYEAKILYIFITPNSSSQKQIK